MKNKYILLLSLSILFFGCCSTEQEKSTGIVNENLSVKMPEYVSNYVPFESQKLPVLRIVTQSGNNNYALKPIASHISDMKKQWNGYAGEPAPYWENCLLTLTDENDEVLMERVPLQVKVRGNWTTNYPKKPLRLKFKDKQPMLGLHDNYKAKNWVLMASYKDWSFLRDSTALYLSKLISPDYTSDFRLVELYSNDDYLGVYLLAERQEIDKKRINISEPKKDYKGTDIGYLLEMDTYAETEPNHFFIDFGTLYDYNQDPVKKYMNGYSIKSDINDINQRNFISNYMINLWKLCYEAVYNQNYLKFNKTKTKLVPAKYDSCYDCISSVIDLESLVNTYIIHEICCDADAAWSSFYLDIDFHENDSPKIKFEAPWDFDSALGNKNFCADSKGIYAGISYWDVNHKEKGWGNPWLILFINCDWFRDLVSQKWTQMRAQNVEEKLLAHIDFVSSTYKENFAADQAVWKNIGHPETLGELCPGAARCKTEKQAADYLAKWLEKRFTYLDEFWLAQ